ncbi:MAG: hypothetical protein JNG89_06360 [Planctomycetaceae bacterium]|nr:hypothetical protein [Planctomycetaceae bacterium]
MNCRQARIDLALCVGEDLPEAARRESLRQHVAQCPGCRAHYKRLRGMQRVLESSDRNRTYDVGGSLWPQLSNRIRRLDESPGPASRFNGWLPFVAVTAACAMLVVVMDLRAPSSGHSPSTEAIPRSMLPGPSMFPGTSQHQGQNTFLPVGRSQQGHAMYDLESAEPHGTQPAQLKVHEPPATTDQLTND